MKSYIKIFSIAFLVMLLFALYSLYFVSSATFDYSSIDLNDVFFILKDVPDLTVGSVFQFNFISGSGSFNGMSISQSGGFYYLNYTYIDSNQQPVNVVAYESDVGWIDSSYRFVYITSADSTNSNTPYLYNYENSRFWLCDNSCYAALKDPEFGFTDLNGLTFRFGYSTVYPLSIADFNSSNPHYSSENNIGVLTYDLGVKYLRTNYQYYGFLLYSDGSVYLKTANGSRVFFTGTIFDSYFPSRDFYFYGGNDIVSSDLTFFLLNNGFFIDYDTSVLNYSNLLDTYVPPSLPPTPTVSYTITYYVDGALYGTLSDYEENYLDVEALATPSSATNYRFDGWYYYNTYTSQAQLNDPISGDITLYGRFVYSPPTYTISFDSNGGSLVTDITGLTIVPSQLPLSTRYGYSFTGWYTDAALQNPVLPGATLSGNITLYAGWQFIPGTDIYVDPANSLRGMFTGLTESLLTTWLTISSQIGFGGITLLSVSITVFAIILIYFTVKIIKG